MSDGLYGNGGETVQWLGRLNSPRDGSPPSSPVTTLSAGTLSTRSLSPNPLLRPMPTSPLDGMGSDRTAGCPPKEADKDWPQRSMCSMSDFGTVPAGLPLGLSDSEKKLWLAIYVKARELLQVDDTTVRKAVDVAIREVTEKHSLEFRFGMRWSHSVKTCLAMRQPYRSSDVYS